MQVNETESDLLYVIELRSTVESHGLRVTGTFLGTPGEDGYEWFFRGKRVSRTYSGILNEFLEHYERLQKKMSEYEARKAAERILRFGGDPQRSVYFHEVSEYRLPLKEVLTKIEYEKGSEARRTEEIRERRDETRDQKIEKIRENIEQPTQNVKISRKLSPSKKAEDIENESKFVEVLQTAYIYGCGERNFLAGDIWRRIAIPKPVVTRCIRRMQEMGFVENVTKHSFRFPYEGLLKARDYLDVARESQILQYKSDKNRISKIKEKQGHPKVSSLSTD